MASVPGLRGMRHIALRVRDIGRSKAFYRENFGMDVVWEPDSENVYLSSGTDNLALHATHESAAPPERQPLPHLGFGVGRAPRVGEIFRPFKVPRDGSASFSLADPDGIIIQMLYEPHLSPQETK